MANETNQLTFGNVTYNLEDHRISSIVDAIYPVGSIYMSVNSADPSTLFGGTWERIQDTFLLAAGESYAAGDTGGEAEHTLTEQELPQFTRKMVFRRFYTANFANNYAPVVSTGSEGISIGGVGTDVLGSNGLSGPVTQQAINWVNNESASAESKRTEGAERVTINFGGGQAHSIMPPYLAVYMWQRTA